MTLELKILMLHPWVSQYGTISGIKECEFQTFALDRSGFRRVFEHMLSFKYSYSQSWLSVLFNQISVQNFRNVCLDSWHFLGLSNTVWERMDQSQEKREIKPKIKGKKIF